MRIFRAMHIELGNIDHKKQRKHTNKFVKYWYSKIDKHFSPLNCNILQTNVMYGQAMACGKSLKIKCPLFGQVTFSLLVLLLTFTCIQCCLMLKTINS